MEATADFRTEATTARIARLIAFSLILSACDRTGTLPGITSATAEHVIHISIDGLRGDLLEELINSQPHLYPAFVRLTTEGAYTFKARTDYTHTNTIPNHTAMITGRPTLQPEGFDNSTHHGYESNSSPLPNVTLHNNGNPNLEYISSTFDVAHDHGLSTAQYASKSKFILFDRSYDGENGGPDAYLANGDQGRDKIDTYKNSSTGVPKNASTLHAEFLSDMAHWRYNYVFLAYRDPDSSGHLYGWGSISWNEAVRDVDGYLGEILDLISSDELLDGFTTIILTADHGGSGTGHSSHTEESSFTIPMIIWGPGVAPNSELYFVNPSRLDPGPDNPDYAAAFQPIRNGGTGNLALAILGLPAVPGSLINANQDLRFGD